MSGPANGGSANRSEPASAVLDEAHIGDIHGALGTIRLDDTSTRRGWRARLLTLFAIMGPGLIVMIGDNDAGGVSTYAQAGQNFGPSLLWTLALLVPVLIVNQEMVVRLGVVTGVGHAKLITERFGKFWGAFSVGDLFVLNFLTIITEFIGVSLAASYFGIPPQIAVPLAAALLVGITVSGNFRSWERFMFVFLLGSLTIIPLMVLSHPSIGTIAHDAVVPSVRGGFSSDAVLLIIAIVGTTVAPWQLFFQQSNVIDKRITPRWMGYERADTVIGAVIVVIAAGGMMMAAAHAFSGTAEAGHYTDAGGIAAGIKHHIGPAAGALFALVLLDASIVGASAVTLATSYAFGDIFGLRHSLHRNFAQAKVFYGSYGAMVVIAASVVLIPRAPLGLITTAVQALAGVLLPSATVFLLLLCNDREVLGPWVNARWLNVISGTIIGVLLVLSLVLVVSTIIPSVNVATLFTVLMAGLGVCLLVGSLFLFRGGGQVKWGKEKTVDRSTWRMPPLALLQRPQWSRGRSLAMWTLSVYLIGAVLLLIVKAIEIAIGH